ncbi:Hypothetical predicted protein [Octopus vulgaris]|uniref:39S ribosomal protein L9, mitochondrial n=1 Tax=Octopus vulgaris TaxID=6645 RepID=A0AA36BEA4_OCTVU|nr:Hypothetical predicted protein [Octopus vulgaris]
MLERRRVDICCIQETLKTLSNMYLAIPMSGDNPWVLSKEHVVVAFRLRGVEVAEEVITLPDKIITEPEEIDIQLKMNGKEEVTVKCLIILKHKDPSKDMCLSKVNQFS